MDKIIAKNIDEYIAHFPGDVQVLLESVRKTIHKAVPEAQECISYAIPCFKLGRNLVHFAGYKKHIGFYPGAAALVAFKKEIAGYKYAKGSVQFPIDKPMPLKLITDIVHFRVKAEEERMKSKKPARRSIAKEGKK